jgi:hypothetical protein
VARSRAATSGGAAAEAWIWNPANTLPLITAAPITPTPHHPRRRRRTTFRARELGSTNETTGTPPEPWPSIPASADRAV